MPYFKYSLSTLLLAASSFCYANNTITTTDKPFAQLKAMSQTSCIIQRVETQAGTISQELFNLSKFPMLLAIGPQNQSNYQQLVLKDTHNRFIFKPDTDVLWDPINKKNQPLTLSDLYKLWALCQQK